MDDPSFEVTERRFDLLQFRLDSLPLRSTGFGVAQSTD
jgi:hypothetical protein